MSQVPAPSAAAWLLDLAHSRGPRFVVLRGDEADARSALIEHLIEIGNLGTAAEAQELVQEAIGEPIGVIW